MRKTLVCFCGRIRVARTDGCRCAGSCGCGVTRCSGCSRQLRNDPSRRGQLAAPKRLFGEYRRYAVAPVHTRFDAVEWFVWDAEITDPMTGRPDVIRQAASEAEAVAGLE
jgi:hypothetical protein